MNDLMTRLNGIRNLISTPFLLLAALSGFVYFVWHLNQLLPPELGQWLASGWARAGLVALGGAAVAWYYYRRGRQSDDRSQALVDAMPVDTLNAKFTSAGLLRRGWPPWQREDLARRPFFILIGPSQAGKTELVKVIARDGVDKKKGVGGTHYCDFFFTPDAVLIDTGGHLIERQDTENDKKGWEHFVALLKKCRPRQPVNGVIVALSLVQHAQLSESECNDKAVAIRNRLYELRKLLDMRFPVYMVFTKLDLAEGFRPFFREVEQEQRKPRWGVTLPYALEGQTEEEVPTVDPCADLDTLQQRLEYLMFVRLAEEQDLPSRPLDCAFPGQMRSLAGLAGEFVKTVFSPPSGELPLLRGVYFTSSLQERSPIDSLLARFGIHVAMAEGRDAPVRRIEKSYFVEDLFRKGVFQDLGLAGRNRSLELREARVFWASAAATVFLALALATTGWRVQQKAEEYAQQIRDDREKLDELAGPFKISAASTKASIKQVQSLLDQAQMLRQAVQQESLPRLLRWVPFGNPYEKLKNSADDLYLKTLDQALLPRLVLGTEDYLHNDLGKSEHDLDALQAYLMLAGEKKYNADKLQKWVKQQYSELFPGTKYEALQPHLEALLAHTPANPYPPDDEMTLAIKRDLGKPIEGKDIYRRVMAKLEKDNDRALTVTELYGTTSGSSIFQPTGSGWQVKYAFTQKGYDKFHAVLEEMLRKDAQNSGLADAANQDIPHLRQEAMDIYRNDYRFAWKDALDQLRLMSWRDIGDFQRALKIIADDPKQSPFAAVLRKAYKETEFCDFNEDEKNRPDCHSDVTKPDEVENKLKNVAPLFEEIASFAKASEKDEASKAVLLDLGALEKNYGNTNTPGLGKWMKGVAQSGSDIINGKVHQGQIQKHQALNERWHREVFEPCQDAINGRYPLTKASQFVEIAEFRRFFKPDGTLDSFLHTTLQTEKDLPPSVKTLQKQAQQIQKMFFANGDLGVAFTLKPGEVEPAESITSSKMDFGDGNPLQQGTGPKGYGKSFSWPTQANFARLTLNTTDGRMPIVEEDNNSPWEWLRFLERAHPSTDPDGHKLLTFSIDGEYKATYIFIPGSFDPFNPEHMQRLQSFSCPETLY